MIANYLALGLVSLLTMTILGYMVLKNALFGTKTRRAFQRAIFVIGVIIISEMGASYFTEPSLFSRAMNIAFCTIGFSISPFVPYLIVSAFAHQRSRLGMILSIPALINLVLVLLSPIYGFIFAVSLANVYVRGHWFAVYVLSYLSSFAFLLVETVRVVRFYQNKNRFSLLWLVLFFMAGTMIQLVWPSIHTTWVSVSIAMVLYYAYYCELIETHDSLTNLFNRRAYEHKLLLMKAKRCGAIILLDADNFKSINDMYGHPFGDKCLMTIAGSMRDAFSKIGSCYRIGGDEFCVLCEYPNEQLIFDAEKAFEMAMTAQQQDDSRIPGVSFGHSIYNEKSHTSIEQAVAEADQLLFLCKENHKRQKGIDKFDPH